MWIHFGSYEKGYRLALGFLWQVDFCLWNFGLLEASLLEAEV